MLEYYALWILMFLSLFGGLIVPLLMGAFLWIERREASDQVGRVIAPAIGGSASAERPLTASA